MKKSFITFLFLAFSAFSMAEPVEITIQDSRLVELTSLNSRNVIFRQYCEDVAASYKNIALDKEDPQIFYKYVAKKDDDLLSLSSRFSIPYETIATLNQLTATDEKLTGRKLMVPVTAGLFIAEKPSSAYEIMIKKEYASLISKCKYSYKIGSNTYFFLQNKRLSPTQRAFFVDTNMKLPLESSILTSDYGYRISPVSNTWKFHAGVDLAAPTGTSVFACKRATVSQTGYNSTYGNHIILLHSNGMTSLYAHLSKILVEKGKVVSAGEKIGLVGTTGASTGPHLHFEIRQNGSPTDPGKLMTID